MTNEQIIAEIKKHTNKEADIYQRLYEQNEFLLKQFCKPYLKYCEIDDLMQECYFGIVEAVEHYESDKEVKFMSFASYWIDRQLRQYVQNCCDIFKLPQHYNTKIPRYKKFVYEYQQEHDRKPTNEEIMQALHIRFDTLEIIQQYLKGCISSSTPLQTEEGLLTIEDTLQADIDVESDICNQMYQDYEKNELWHIVDGFTNNQEYEVLRCLFINGLTYKQTGERLNVSKQRIEQVKRKAITNLRTGRAKRKLIDKLEVVDSGLYRGSYNQYRLRENTSVVEHIALKDFEIKKELTKVS